MRKAIAILSAIFVSYFASAQCVADPNIGNGLYPSGDSLPCATVGQPYTFTFQFRNLDSFTVTPIVITDSIVIDSVVIGSGWTSITFGTDKPNNRFLAGENGCITFSGNAPPTPSRDTVKIYFTLSTSSLGKISGFFDGTFFNGLTVNYDTIHTIILNTIPHGGICPSPGINRINYVKGKIYYDTDGNGSLGANDFPMPRTPITLNPGGGIFYTNSQGYYYAFVDTGSYNISLAASANYSISSSPLIYNASLPNVGDSAINLNFGLIPTDTIVDLSVVATSSFTRPGFASKHWITYQNTGTVVIDSGTITYTIDSNYIFDFANPNYTSQNGGTYTWKFYNLFPNEQRTIAIDLSLPANINLMGDTLISTGTINPAVSTDGSFVNEVVVTASYDPNDKTAYPTGILDEAFIDSGEPLLYRIRFQNTGTDTAFNIQVRDTLDFDKLEPTSIRLIGASHEYTFRIEQGNIAIWDFRNILLPDSNMNEPGSHGFILFEVGMWPGLAHGEVVENRAGIYFDFNPVVLTEYAVSNVDFGNSINGLDGKNNCMVYPNPSNGRLVVYQDNWQNGSTITIFDLNGKKAMEASLISQRTDLSIGDIPNGIYLYQIKDNNGIEGMGKLVVSH